MFKKLCFLISFVSVLSLAYISYGDADPRMIKLDFDEREDVNTEPGFTSFLISDTGKEVNSVIVDLGGNIDSYRREGPSGMWWPEPPDPNAVYYRRCYEDIYRDFIFGYGSPPSGVTIILCGLGAGRECEITIYAFDDKSTSDANRIANWTANGAYLLTTEFQGGVLNWPGYEGYDDDEDKYAFTGTATADELGRILLESAADPCSQEGEPFAFVNALVVVPSGDFVPVKYAHCPQPADEKEGVPVNVVLSWKPAGAFTPTHDIYLGTDETAVTDANRASHSQPGLLIYKPNYSNNTYDPCGSAGFLKFEQTYYWRVDEVNGTPDSIFKGGVWSFTTTLSCKVEDFDSYENSDALRDIWKDYWENGTSARVYVEEDIARDGNSMRYRYRDDLIPYYSEAYADMAVLGVDPNWLGIGAESLSLWFFGQEDNPVDEQMYIALTDGDGKTGVVNYDDMNDIQEKKWQEWNIDLQDFVDDNDVNLANVARITIGFGDGTEGSEGEVYFEDIQLHTTRCVLSKRPADFAMVDYAPLGNPAGDCVVDYQELAIMAETWLYTWDALPPVPPWPPSIPNLVAYWSMNEGDGDQIFTDPYDPAYTGTFSEEGVSWVTPGSPYSADAALYFDGEYGTRVSCGNMNPASEANELSLAIWAKWAGRRYWDTYLLSKGQGVISKRNGWSPTGLQFMFEVDTYGYRGTFALRQYSSDVFAPENILMGFIGQWVHLAATYDGTISETACKLYLNGSEVASGPFIFGANTTAGLTIGNTCDEASWADSPEVFYGCLDEACIYNRALTAEEIEYLAGYSGWYPPWLPPPSNLYDECAWCPRVINFKDFAVLANYWLEEFLWP